MLHVNFNDVVGTIKPMHGVGQPPFQGLNFSMCDYLKDAHIPSARLHDVGGWFGGNMFVDIPNIFRDFDADPTDPNSYDFVFTDLLITALIERGIEPVFRLGVTIENFWKVKAYRIYPPADNLKWAQICEGIIRHYTQGWANGFTYPIRYWEIWNEPDNDEDPMLNAMWRGTKEQFFELYTVAATYLKEKFPHLKIGGYGSCGFYTVINHNSRFGNSSDRFAYFIEFLDAFLTHIRQHNAPLDFFTWHSYIEIPEENVILASAARKRLDDAGFTHTEHFLNEWNPSPDLKGTMQHAALIAAHLIALQGSSLAGANFYDARCGMGIYSSMFDCMTCKPLPAYYAFVAFGELYSRGAQISTRCDIPGVYACGAKGENSCLMIANTNDAEVSLSPEIFGANRVLSCRILCEGKLWQQCPLPQILPAHAVICIFFE